MAMLVWGVGRLWLARRSYRLQMACGWVDVMQQLEVDAIIDEIRKSCIENTSHAERWHHPELGNVVYDSTFT